MDGVNWAMHVYKPYNIDKLLISFCDFMFASLYLLVHYL